MYAETPPFRPSRILAQSVIADSPRCRNTIEYMPLPNFGLIWTAAYVLDDFDFGFIVCDWRPIVAALQPAAVMAGRTGHVGGYAHGAG